MAIQVGRWDCAACGHRGILGPETTCPNCAAPRGKDVKFYLPEDAPDLTDDTELYKAQAGADWLCDFCGADNKPADAACHSCGNPRTTDDAQRQEKVYDLSAVPLSGNRRPTTQEILAQQASAAEVAPKKKSSGRLWWILGGVVLLVVWLFYPRTYQVTVSGHEWERTVMMENYRAVTEEDWSVPSGGKQLTSFRALHHTDRVLSGYVTRTRTKQVQTGTRKVKSGKRDKGNGYFEDVYRDEPVYKDVQESYQEPVYRDVPVYQTKYRYEIMRWTPDHPIRAGGTDKAVKNPQEPHADRDKWREGNRTEKYVLKVKDPDGTEHADSSVSFQFWNRVESGQQLDATRGAMGGFYGIKDKDK